MASMTIRNLDDGLKARLRVRAAQHGRSMEEEVRVLLRQALDGPRAAARPHLADLAQFHTRVRCAIANRPGGRALRQLGQTVRGRSQRSRRGCGHAQTACWSGSVITDPRIGPARIAGPPGG